MVTKIDRAVIRYLGKLAKPNPPARDEAAICARLDELDAARFRVLDVLIRRARYSRLTGRFQQGRKLWRSRGNPHRPVTL